MRAIAKSLPWEKKLDLYKRIFRCALYTLIVYLSFIGSANAVCTTVGGAEGCFDFFNPFDAQIKEQGDSFMETITGLVHKTFFILAILDLCWAAAIWAFEKDEMNSLTVEIAKRVAIIGFFYVLLLNAKEWIHIIIETFGHAGTEVLGTSADVATVDGIIARGFAVVAFIWRDAPTLKDALILGFIPNIPKIIDFLVHLPAIIVATFVSAIVIVAYVILAAQLFCLNVESYICVAAGSILLGLGGSEWTRDYSKKIFEHAMMTGVRLLVLLLILALSNAIVDQATADFEFEVIPILKLMGLVILQMLLGMNAPEMGMALMGQGTGFSLAQTAAAAQRLSGAAAGVKSALSKAAKGGGK